MGMQHGTSSGSSAFTTVQQRYAHKHILMQKTLKQLHLHEPRQINEPVATSKGKGMQLTKAI